MTDMAGMHPTSPFLSESIRQSPCGTEQSLATKSLLSNEAIAKHQNESGTKCIYSRTDISNNPFGDTPSLKHCHSNEALATRNGRSNGDAASVASVGSQESERDLRRRARKQVKQELLGRGRLWP